MTFDDGYKYKEAECRDEIAATIERCAQVAEKEAVNKNLTESAATEANHIAAAIRKLKEDT
jgi:hypothetical protein